MKIKAIIFDMDGTLIDTGNLWIQSAIEVNESTGFDASLDEIKSYIGTGKKDEYAAYIKKVFNDKILNGQLSAKKGVLNVLKFLKSNNIKIALATSSNSEKIEKRFLSAGIDKNLFDVIVSGEMVTKNKPDPEIYLTACKILGCDTKNIVVVEDSDTGIAAAKGADLFSVLVPDVCQPHHMTVEIADKVFADFDYLLEFIKWNM